MRVNVWYTPGISAVSAVSTAIRDDNTHAFTLNNKSNLVADTTLWLLFKNVTNTECSHKIKMECKGWLFWKSGSYTEPAIKLKSKRYRRQGIFKSLYTHKSDFSLTGIYSCPVRKKVVIPIFRIISFKTIPSIKPQSDKPGEVASADIILPDESIFSQINYFCIFAPQLFTNFFAL